MNILPGMQIAESEARIAKEDSQLMADKTALAEKDSESTPVGNIRGKHIITAG
jgi:hypothetical protein